MTTRRFDSKAAIVTGGARGIGFATALRLAKEGASVAVFDLDSEAASSAAKAIAEETDARVIGLPCDVSDATATESAVEQVVTELGGIHVLVNNAGG